MPILLVGSRHICLCVHLTSLARSIVLQTLARAWEAWREDAAHCGELKHRLSHIVAKWQQQRLLSSWNAFRDHVAYARTLRMVRSPALKWTPRAQPKLYAASTHAWLILQPALKSYQILLPDTACHWWPPSTTECSLLWQAMHHLSGQLLWKAWETWRAYGQAWDEARGKLAQAASCWQNARVRAAWLQWDSWAQVCSPFQACVLLCRAAHAMSRLQKPISSAQSRNVACEAGREMQSTPALTHA